MQPVSIETILPDDIQEKVNECQNLINQQIEKYYPLIAPYFNKPQ